MRPLTRRTLADLAAQIIAEAIRSGEMTGTLPGYRSLIQRLGISRSALIPAIDKLLEEGWLQSAGPRKRYITNVVEGGETMTELRPRKLWVVEPMERKEISAIPPHVAWSLISRFRKLGWNTEWSVITTDQNRRHDSKWNRLLEFHQPDSILLIAPHRTTAEWAADCGLPVCVLGGDAHELPLSTVGIDSSFMVGCALENILSMGHRDVCLLLSVRTPGYVTRIHETMKVILAEYGIPFVPAWHAPLALSTTPEGLLDLMESRFALSQPTAMMAFGKNGLSMMMGYAMQRGLIVPRDISLVMLGDVRGADWVRPTIASFEMPWNRVINFTIRWLTPGGHRNGQHQSSIFKPKWIDGESLASPGRSLIKRKQR